MTVRQRLLTLARGALGVVPDAVLSRILPGRLGWDDAAMRVAEAPPDAIRVYIAPANSAGQGYQWARAVERNLAGVGAVSLMTVNAATERFGFPADVRVPDSGFIFANRWQRRQRDVILNDFTHVLLESGRFVYGSIPGRTPLQVAEQLVIQGRSVALIWHGSDIRVPSEHAKSEPDSPFGDTGEYPRDATAVLESNARRNLQMIEESDLPVFVSTPGLLDVPRASWLPVVVDTDRWRSAEAPLDRDIPVVAYAPSNSPMKGNASIDDQLTALDADGVISYRKLQGIPAGEMPDSYREADIVLDQFRLGDYGVAACEAMAAGRVVIGHVSAENRERVRATAGLDLPIVESRLSDVASTITQILDDREKWRQHAQLGPEFVRTLHDGTASARALADFLGATSTTSERTQDV